MTCSSICAMQADRGGVVGPTPRVKPPLLGMYDLRRTRTKLLVFVAFSLQLPQSLCLQTTSLRTCSLDVTTPHLAEEVLQVLHACQHLVLFTCAIQTCLQIASMCQSCVAPSPITRSFFLTCCHTGRRCRLSCNCLSDSTFQLHMLQGAIRVNTRTHQDHDVYNRSRISQHDAHVSADR